LRVQILPLAQGREKKKSYGCKLFTAFTTAVTAVSSLTTVKMVENLTHNLKVNGSNPANNTGKRK
jgi:hypothetical protein